MSASTKLLRPRYQWVCWTFGLSLSAILLSFVFSALSFEAIALLAYGVAFISMWAYYISIGRLAGALGKSAVVWAGATILTAPIGGAFVAFFRIRHLFLKEVRRHTGAPSAQPTPEALKTAPTPEPERPTMAQPGGPAPFPEDVQQVMYVSVNSMDLSQDSPAAVIRLRIGDSPMEPRAIFELAALDAFAVVHATHPALADIATPSIRRDATFALINHAAYCWQRQFPRAFANQDASTQLFTRMTAYEDAFRQGFNEPNGPFWAVAKEFLRFCGQERSAVHAITATEYAGTKFRNVVEMLEEMAQPKVPV